MPGYCYLISDGECYKIGSTQSSPKQRLRSLQTGNSKKLKLVHAIQATVMPAIALERRLQRCFLLRRCRGEWYFLSPEIIEWLKTISRDTDIWEA